MLQPGHMTTDHGDLVFPISSGDHSEKVSQRILRLVEFDMFAFLSTI